MARMEDAVAALKQRMQASVAVDVIYHRGMSSVVLLGKVWVGRTMFRVTDSKGSRVIWSDRDFLIPVGDLAIDSVLVTPQDGDWIEQVFSGPEGNQNFELLSIPNEPKWRYSDPQRTIYRIHTKRVVYT